MMVHVTVVTPASWDSLSEDSPLGTEACHSLPPPLTWGLFTRLHLNTWMPDVRLLPSALSPCQVAKMICPVCPLPSYIQMIQGTKRQGLGDSWGLGTVLRPPCLSAVINLSSHSTCRHQELRAPSEGPTLPMAEASPSSFWGSFLRSHC